MDVRHEILTSYYALRQHLLFHFPSIVAQRAPQCSTIACTPWLGPTMKHILHDGRRGLCISPRFHRAGGTAGLPNLLASPQPHSGIIRRPCRAQLLRRRPKLLVLRTEMTLSICRSSLHTHPFPTYRTAISANIPRARNTASPQWMRRAHTYRVQQSTF